MSPPFSNIFSSLGNSFILSKLTSANIYDNVAVINDFILTETLQVVK